MSAAEVRNAHNGVDLRSGIQAIQEGLNRLREPANIRLYLADVRLQIQDCHRNVRRERLSIQERISGSRRDPANVLNQLRADRQRHGVDIAHREILQRIHHHSLLAFARVPARHVAGSLFLAALQRLQRKAGLRRVVAGAQPRPSGAQGDRFEHPCSAAEAHRYARALRQLLESLDGEIVVAALVGECESDLLDAERQEVDRVFEFLDGRIAMRSEPTRLRGRALAVLDAFLDQLESGGAR